MRPPGIESFAPTDEAEASPSRPPLRRISVMVGSCLLAAGVAIVGSSMTWNKEAAGAVSDDPDTAQEQLAKAGVAIGPGSVIAAAQAGNVVRLRLLRAAGQSWDVRDAGGMTPLMAASLAGQREAVSTLLSAGADSDTRDRAGFSALSYAVAAGQREIVSDLLDAGASARVEAHPGESVFAFAVRTGDSNLAARLLHSGAAAGRGFGDDLSPLDRLVDAGDSHLVREILRSGEARAAVRGSRAGILAVACESNLADRDLAELFLKAGADPDAGDAARGLPSPMTRAVAADDLAMTELLLNYCADPSLQVRPALEGGMTRLAHLLFDHGADLSAAPPAAIPVGEDPPPSPVFLALDSGHPALLERVLDAGGDTSAVGGTFGQSPLVTALLSRDVATARVLLDHGADPNLRLSAPHSDALIEMISHDRIQYYLRDDSGFTPLMIAVAMEDEAAVRLLLERGASKGLTTRDWKRYPIQLAADLENIRLQQILLNRDPETIPPAEQVRVVIDLSDQRATLFRGGAVVTTSKVSTGMRGYETPAGEFVISNKYRHWTSTIYDVDMPYFQRLSCKAFGFHQGYVPNHPASHGCIRMPTAKAKEFFGLTKTGDVVAIVP